MPRQQLALKRKIEVRDAVDVFVAGGGPAGIAAAVTAARQGRRVFLAEWQNCLGGMGTAGMEPVFVCFGDDVNFCAGGFGREVFGRAEAEGHPQGPWGPWNPPIRVEVLKRIYDDMAQCAGIQLSLTTQVIGVETDGDRVTHVICAAKSGLFACAAQMVVDGTGDGDVCAWAGAPFEKGDEAGAVMGGTLCSLWAGIDWDEVAASGLDAETRLGEAFKEDPDVLPYYDRHLPGIIRVGQTTGGGNIGHVYDADGTDELSLTKAFIWGRKLMPYYERFYKTCLKGYEKMSLVATAPMLGVRESRRILGDYVLCRDDWERRAIFGDEIGRYNYWIDTHETTATPDQWTEFQKLFRKRYEPGETYGIPYRILTPRGLSNVLVAGRCVSTDRAMQSSIRPMPGCFITGQAAGMAAAMAVEGGTNTRGVDVRQLQPRLRSMGAFLPNA